MSTRLLWAVGVAALGTCTLGVVLAIAAVTVAHRLNVGCDRILIDSQTDWVCPDGIGYLFPALMVMLFTGVVCFVAAVVVKFRSVPQVDRIQLSSALVGGVGWALAISGVLAVAVTALSAQYSTLAIWMSAFLVALAVTLILTRGRDPVVVTPICVATAVLLAGYSVCAVFLAPALMAFVGLLCAAVVLRLGRFQR